MLANVFPIKTKLSFVHIFQVLVSQKCTTEFLINICVSFYTLSITICHVSDFFYFKLEFFIRKEKVIRDDWRVVINGR